jgi:hypothetical protein
VRLAQASHGHGHAIESDHACCRQCMHRVRRSKQCSRHVRLTWCSASLVQHTGLLKPCSLNTTNGTWGKPSSETEPFQLMLGLHEAERTSNNIQKQCLHLLSSHQKTTLTASRLPEELTVCPSKDDNHMVSLPVQNCIEHHMIWKGSADICMTRQL